jgi:cbb3-type cytochrome oxidase subunit 3
MKLERLAHLAAIGSFVLYAIIELYDRWPKGLTFELSVPDWRTWLLVAGIAFSILSVYLSYWRERRRRRAASSALTIIESDEWPIMRTSGGGYAKGASDDKAIVLLFENTTGFDYSNVRAWLRYATRETKDNEWEECSGFWLGETWRSVEFKSKNKKALVIAVRDRNGKFSLLTNPRECHDAAGLPKLIPIDDSERVHIILVVMNVDGVSVKPFRCQLTLPPDFDFRWFMH